MIERVAQAIEDANLKASGDEDYTPLARAAIEEMREPTMDMMYRGGGRTGGNMSIAANAYRTMIDAALNEQVAG